MPGKIKESKNKSVNHIFPTVNYHCSPLTTLGSQGHLMDNEIHLLILFKV